MFFQLSVFKYLPLFEQFNQTFRPNRAFPNCTMKCINKCSNNCTNRTTPLVFVYKVPPSGIVPIDFEVRNHSFESISLRVRRLVSTLEYVFFLFEERVTNFPKSYLMVVIQQKSINRIFSTSSVG